MSSGKRACLVAAGGGESEAERRRETGRMDMDMVMVGKGWVEGGGARPWKCWEGEERNSENRGRKRK